MGRGEDRREESGKRNEEKSKEEKKAIVGENVTEKVDREFSKENVRWKPGRESWFSERIRFLGEQRKRAKRQTCEKRA